MDNNIRNLSNCGLYTRPSMVVYGHNSHFYSDIVIEIGIRQTIHKVYNLAINCKIELKSLSIFNIMIVYNINVH